MIKILAVIGFLLSLYAYHVEKKSVRKNYKPVCDINKSISCTRAFSSKYGKLLGESNSFYGMFFYPLIFLLTQLNLINIVFLILIFSFLGTIYLAYLSYIKLKTFCLVCTSIYLINLLLLFLSYKSL